MSAEKPNVLLICTDHWSGLLTRGAGHPVLMTPTIDQLGRSGTTFTNAYSACPSCIPARRSLMTGMSPRANGLREYQEGAEFPEVQTLAQCFRDAGYQAYAVGKVHVSPQRHRIGFDDVLLDEQGRHQFREVPEGDADDYELFLAEQGYGGQEYASGMAHNEFLTRTWHLSEYCHPINWTAREMCRAIRRRDPRKPGFWYLSFCAPHPPITPLPAYMDLYRDVSLDPLVSGNWSEDFARWPYHIKTLSNPENASLMRASAHEVELSRRAYYATLTHIDHQIRLVLGYLREAGLLNNTILVFTSNHGHMVGDHGMWCMTPFYEMSAKIPLTVVPALGNPRLAPGTCDGRLAEFADIMPTLLDLAGIEIPQQVDRLSLFGPEQRDYLYGEHGEGAQAMRMMRAEHYKLIYYPVGNHLQLFDLEADPRECNDLAGQADCRSVQERLTRLLAENLYGEDLQWIEDGQLTGLPKREFKGVGDRNMRNQRGLRFI